MSLSLYGFSTAFSLLPKPVNGIEHALYVGYLSYSMDELVAKFG